MEKRDLYDENRKLTGETIYKGNTVPKGKYYITVIIFIQNENNEFLIQKRVPEKDGKWATTGGHPISGQTSKQGIITEIKEELGINVEENNIVLIKTIKTEDDFVDIYYLKENVNMNKIKIQKEEVEEVKWSSETKIKELIEYGEFSKSHTEFFKICLDYLENKKRCRWCNLKNELYVKYHDEEWCKPNFSDEYLYEMLILESFQAGLSWECVLNKRESFRKAFDKFDINKVCNYDDKKIQELIQNKDIIRNKLKINATINNSKIFKEIQKEYGSFYNYLKFFTNDIIIYETDKTTNELSNVISKDLQKRGMKFVGSTIIYSYLQAIGIIYSHEKGCFLYKEEEKTN